LLTTCSAPQVQSKTSRSKLGSSPSKEENGVTPSQTLTINFNKKTEMQQQKSQFIAS